MNWRPFYEKNIEKNLTILNKIERGIFQHPLSENIKKLKVGPLCEEYFFFAKKSYRDENTLKEYPLAPLSFLDDVKIAFEKVKVLRQARVHDS